MNMWIDKVMISTKYIRICYGTKNKGTATLEFVLTSDFNFS